MSFSGSLEAVKLADIVQMCCLASVDGDLQLTHGGFIGRIFLSKGQVVHAEAADRNGEAALYLLLTLRQGWFEFRPDVAVEEQSISAEWEYLLIEAARCKDEQPVLVFPPSRTPKGKLAEMLQMYCLAFMEGVVRVEHEGIAGHIYLREGQLIHAKTRKKRGEEALYDLLCLDDATVDFQTDVDTPEDSIYGNWEHLLAEGARRKGELESRRMLYGDLTSFKLADILQMCCVSGMSGDLQLIRDGSYGDIYLNQGQIVHAQVGLHKGEGALHFLLSFRQGTFEFRKDETSPEETIHGQWEYLLIEAARLRDESTPAADSAQVAATAQNGKMVSLVNCCKSFRGFKGAVLLTPTGELLASSFNPLETQLMDLIAKCAELYHSLENEFSVGNGNLNKCFFMNFQENAFVTITQPQHLIVLLVDRKSSSDPLLLDLVRTIRQSDEGGA
jgi:hypothetical protein